MDPTTVGSNDSYPHGIKYDKRKPWMFFIYLLGVVYFLFSLESCFPERSWWTILCFYVFSPRSIAEKVSSTTCGVDGNLSSTDVEKQNIDLYKKFIISNFLVKREDHCSWIKWLEDQITFVFLVKKMIFGFCC